MDLLSALVDKSLVAVTPRDDEMRYGMLEPVRQYAQERLETSGEADELRSRHAAYFLAEAGGGGTKAVWAAPAVVAGQVGRGARQPACCAALVTQAGGRSRAAARKGIVAVLAHSRIPERGEKMAGARA